MIYSFEDYCLDADRRELRRGTELVSVEPQVFDLLLYLLQEQNRVVSRDDLIASIWKGRIVSDSTLASRITAVRHAIGDSGDQQRLIRTISRRGFRFVGTIRVNPAGLSEGAQAATRQARSATDRLESGSSAAARENEPALAGPHQDVRYCYSRDGVRLAYAMAGTGPILVKAGNWLNHLEYDWESPVWRHVLHGLAQHHTLLRYDARGNGLSDWDVAELSLDAWVSDLETVIDAAGVKRFPLLGISQGCAVSVAYAVRHPERVSHLVLYGGYTMGAKKRTPHEKDLRNAMLTLARLEWGSDNPAFRQLFTNNFIPGATKEQADFFNELQRRSTSPGCAARYMDVTGDFDITDMLGRVTAPTLVMHVRGDLMVPVECGRALASGIPSARFVTFPGQNHFFLESEIASKRFFEELTLFLDDSDDRQRKGVRSVGEVTGQRDDSSRAQAHVERGLPVPDKPSIAVLPFKNLSDDVAQEYFVDGIVEEMTTALSQFSQLFVVARSSSFTYKGRDVDVQQVGRELGVRYVLEGSIRKASGRVRITVQLINTLTAVQLWAARFDGVLAEVFDLQDQVASGVVGVIAPKIEQAEIERAKRKPTGSLDAYDYYLHGLASLYQDSREANDAALRLFGKARELDPNFAAAYGMGALCYVGRQWKHWMLDPQKEVSETARLVNRAAELGRDDAMALSAAGMAAGIVVRDLDRAIVLLDRSLLLNPNLAISWVRSAWVRIFLGDFDLAIEHASRAMRLSPLDPFLVGMESAIAFAHFCAGRNDLAMEWAEKAVREQPTFAPALRPLAASSASLGRMKEATEALARLREINAIFHISEMQRYLPFREPKYFAKYAEALRKAGFPE